MIKLIFEKLGFKILKFDTYKNLESLKSSVSNLLLINSRLSDKLKETQGFSSKNNIYQNIELVLLAIADFKEIKIYHIKSTSNNLNFDIDYLTSTGNPPVSSISSFSEINDLEINKDYQNCLVVDEIVLEEITDKLFNKFEFIFINELTEKNLSEVKKLLNLYTLINDYDIGFGKLFAKKIN